MNIGPPAMKASVPLASSGSTTGQRRADILPSSITLLSGFG
jgi:hypothetical protein